MEQEAPGPSSSMARANAPDEVLHRIAIEMFPDLDLTGFIKQFGQQMATEGLIALILDRRAQIPKKRKPIEDDADDVDSQIDSDPCFSGNDELGNLLIDKLLATLVYKIKLEVQRQQRNVNIRNVIDRSKRDFLAYQFLGVRMNFIDNMLIQFKNALLPASIACFFAENNFANKLAKLLPILSQNFWLRFGTPLQIKRRRNNQQRVPTHVAVEFRRYTKMMRRYQEGQYAALLTDHLELVQHYRQIRWERTRTEPEEKIECLVCSERVPLRRITYCSAPTTQLGLSNVFAADEDKPEPNHAFAADEDKPGPSNAFAADEDVITAGTSGRDDQHDECSMSDVSASDEGITDPSTHLFCRDCIRGHAQAATEQQPLAEGNVGLRCMMPNCKNPILYTGIRSFLSRDICKKLDERIMIEEVEMAHIPNLERCKRCNYAAEMDVDKSINKVFQCQQCDAKFCRICDNDWDDDHFGISCEEVEQKTKRSRKDRELEKQLNEAVIRKCPRCGLVFMKDEGCNKMTCRCGMTSCYICRAEKIDYTHFCQHVRDPNNRDGRCNDCNKTCLLFEDPRRKDEQLIARIRQEAAEKNDKESN